MHKKCKEILKKLESQGKIKVWWDFQFPKPFDNGIRLKDILETEVDESFYISQDKVEKMLSQIKNKDSLLFDMSQAKREDYLREYNEFSPTLNSRDYKEPRLVNQSVNIVGKLNSSQDGIVVSQNGISPTHTAGHGNCPKVLNKNGKIMFWSIDKLEFGRSPFEILSSPNEKLRYLFASYSNDDDKIEEITDVLREVIDGFTGVEFPISTWSKEEYRGSIDHESIGILRGYLEKNNIPLKEFLFNKKYVIIVDGDEYNEWDKLKNAGLVNLNEIEIELPNYD